MSTAVNQSMELGFTTLVAFLDHLVVVVRTGAGEMVVQHPRWKFDPAMVENEMFIEAMEKLL